MGVQVRPSRPAGSASAAAAQNVKSTARRSGRIRSPRKKWRAASITLSPPCMRISCLRARKVRGPWRLVERASFELVGLAKGWKQPGPRAGYKDGADAAEDRRAHRAQKTRGKAALEFAQFVRR